MRFCLRHTSVFAFLLPIACGSTDEPKDTPAAETVVVAPATTNVATCRGASFTATPADGVTWSLEGQGTLTEGKYEAPKSAPSPATATVKATRGAASGTAAITVATAFPEAAIDTPRGFGNGGAPDFVRGVASRGQRAYALVKSGEKTASLAKSVDGGLTWSAAVLVGGERASAVAIDAGNDDIVYVLVHGLDSDAGSTLTLHTSIDGGATFTAKPIYSGGNGDVLDADIVSPAPNQIVISASTPWQDGDGGQGAELLVWHDGANGTTFGPFGALGNGYDAQSVPAKVTRPASGILYESGNGRYGSHFSTNGAGKVCLSTAEYNIDGKSETHRLQCSTDGGATFGAPVVTATGLPTDFDRPRVALNSDGSVVVVAYNTYANILTDAIGKTAYVVSVDGGATFGAAKLLPDVFGSDELPRGVRDVEITFDGEGNVWFARTVDTSSIQVDKSCDRGETLSGSFFLPIEGTTTNAVLFESSAGIFAGGIRIGATDHGLSVVRLLQPLAK